MQRTISWNISDICCKLTLCWPDEIKTKCTNKAPGRLVESWKHHCHALRCSPDHPLPRGYCIYKQNFFSTCAFHLDFYNLRESASYNINIFSHEHNLILVHFGAFLPDPCRGSSNAPLLGNLFPWMHYSPEDEKLCACACSSESKSHPAACCQAALSKNKVVSKLIQFLRFPPEFRMKTLTAERRSSRGKAMFLFPLYSSSVISSQCRVVATIEDFKVTCLLLFLGIWDF